MVVGSVRCVSGGLLEEIWSQASCFVISLIALIMSEKELHPLVAQRIVIKFLTNKGIKSAKIRDRLRAQFGEKHSWKGVMQDAPAPASCHKTL